jgi:ElaA protein
MNIYIKHYNELNIDELYEIIQRREEVFLLEQNIICRDLDDIDKISYHAFIKEDGRIVSYLRFFNIDNDIMIGRVLSIIRNKGYGTLLMNSSIKKIKELYNDKTIKLHAQLSALNFYKKLNFIESGNKFLEEGVWHILMVYNN